MTMSGGRERGVIRPGSRRNGGFQVESTRRWAEEQGIRRYDGRQAGIRRLRQGNRWEGGRSGGELAAADARIDLARTLLEQLAPGEEPSPGTWSGWRGCRRGAWTGMWRCGRRSSWTRGLVGRTLVRGRR